MMAVAPMAGPRVSAMDANTEAFPKLTAAQIERVRPVAKVRKAVKGEILFEPGDTGVPFFVLLSGVGTQMTTTSASPSTLGSPEASSLPDLTSGARTLSGMSPIYDFPSLTDFTLKSCLS